MALRGWLTERRLSDLNRPPGSVPLLAVRTGAFERDSHRYPVGRCGFRRWLPPVLGKARTAV